MYPYGSVRLMSDGACHPEKNWVAQPIRIPPGPGGKTMIFSGHLFSHPVSNWVGQGPLQKLYGPKWFRSPVSPRQIEPILVNFGRKREKELPKELPKAPSSTAKTRENVQRLIGN